ncbi:benzoate-CoA ligase family protein [Acidibrevibacterium fodinaquatile]|uniref:benzoate-CoA ligase family protein n=1 Tax=Acidibrevibacterium fodinaquatile TaxID=1969806 RepID=UPI001F073E14|nr:benzoate-CoA ligase family protein [Acidibrevibacterium fodinaquatile]
MRGGGAAEMGADGACGNATGWFVDRHEREGRGERIAFIDPWRRLTYGALQDQAARFAGALLAAGLRREQRIALILRDSCAFPVAFWGALRAGIVPVPLNTLLPPALLAALVADCRAGLVLISAPLYPALAPALAALTPQPTIVIAEEDAESLPAGQRSLSDFLASAAPAPLVATSPDEVAFWLYSSGSTSTPKGTRHVHASLRATYETYGRQVLGIAPDDVMFSAAKLFFAYGLGNAMTFPMAVGAAAVLLPDRPTPERVFAVMQRYQPSLFGGVPTLYAALLAHPALSHGAGSARLRRAISAGEPLPEPIGRAWRQRVGVDILDGIGSTEMLHIFLSNRPDDIRYGSTGRAVPGYDLKLVDEQDRELAGVAEGELLVRGASAADGYWNQREKSRRTFLGEWTRTGDTYARDAEGYYHYRGRADDMMKVSGIWVSPFEVEAALVEHPAILEAAVVGHEDADGLTKPRAFVVLKEGVTVSPDLIAALQTLVKERAGPWKYPRWIEIVADLPKTATGKIQRFKLRDLR